MSQLDFRFEFPVVATEGAFFNHAGVAPLPRRGAEAIQKWCDQASTEVLDRWADWSKALTRTRRNAAKLAGCRSEEIAYMTNTTHGLFTVARTLDWRPGDNLITCDHEFPANVYPWRNLSARGIATRVVQEREGRFTVNDFISQMDSRTRLVAVSMVHYATGFRMPVESLAEACHSRGILLCLDGIQALGALNFNVKDLGCDFLAAGGHKWMLAPEGTGILYVSESAMNRLDASTSGWMGRTAPGNYADTNQPPAATAKRFEGGSHALGLAVGFEKSLELLLEVGQPAIWSGIESLTARLTEGLNSLGLEIISSRRDGERSGIVAFRAGVENAEDWAVKLRERKLRVVARRNFLRVAPHFYTPPEHIDLLLNALKEIKAGG